MNLVERVKGILLSPKTEWPKIESEPGDPGYLYTNYVAIVAAIPPVCSFIGTSIIGFGAFRIPIITGLLHAILTYILTLAIVYLVALLIDFLGQYFGAQKNFGNAMRVSSYAPTAAWVVGIFNIIPALSILGILGLYSIYLLYTGIAQLMRPAADKAIIYTIAVIVAVLIIWVVVFTILARLLGFGMMTMM